MKLSIIIVNWNVAQLLKQLVASIFRFTPENLSFEVIVVDNNSTDRSVNTLRQNFKAEINNNRLKIIANEKNLGFAKANNLGFKKSRGEFVVFMNPDMELLEDSFSKLLKIWQAKENLGILTCSLLYEDKTRQANIKGFPKFCDQLLVLLKLHHFLSWLPCLKKYLQKNFDYKKERIIDQAMGAFVFTKKEIMEKINAWDEDYWLWWEDVELCFKVKELGYKNLYTPKTQIVHYEGKSFAQTFGLKKQKRFNSGMLIYFKKRKKYFSWFILLLLQPVSYLLTLLTQLFKIKPRTQSKV